MSFHETGDGNRIAEFGAPLLVATPVPAFTFRGFSWHSIDDKLSVAEAHYVASATDPSLMFSVRTSRGDQASGAHPGRELREHIQSVVFNQEQDLIAQLGMGSPEYRHHREDVTVAIRGLDFRPGSIEIDGRSTYASVSSFRTLSAVEIALGDSVITIVSPPDFLESGFATRPR